MRYSVLSAIKSSHENSSMSFPHDTPSACAWRTHQLGIKCRCIWLSRSWIAAATSQQQLGQSLLSLENLRQFRRADEVRFFARIFVDPATGLRNSPEFISHKFCLWYISCNTESGLVIPNILNKFAMRSCSKGYVMKLSRPHFQQLAYSPPFMAVEYWGLIGMVANDLFVMIPYLGSIPLWAALFAL